MRVVTWNCARAFRKKVGKALNLRPDIVVVPECENPSTCKDKAWLSDFTEWRWFGDNNTQGVGLFFCREVQLVEQRPSGSEIKFIEMYDVIASGLEFTIIPVWANNAQSPKFRYIGQVWQFLEKYKHELEGREVILIGDLNSNKIWDKASRWWNHSDVVRVLKEIGIESLYHVYKDVEHGSEPENTFFLYKHQDKGYHIDYIFGSQHFKQNLSSVSVPPYAEWCGYSDHNPVICDFKPAVFAP